MKNIVDDAIDQCAEVYNLRDSIENSRIRAEQSTDDRVKKQFAQRVQPSIQVATLCGNMYCASVYGGLVSLLCNVDSEQLLGKRVAIFSYGSGLASSFFSLRIRGSTKEIAEKIDLHRRLDARRTVPPEVYDEVSVEWRLFESVAIR